VGPVLLSDLYHVLTMVSVVVLSKLDFFLPGTCSKQVAAQGRLFLGLCFAKQALFQCGNHSGNTKQTIENVKADMNKL
jgi:imidazoleglycerol phosphate synthase glutamine amidotransferase subunit HisH